MKIDGIKVLGLYILIWGLLSNGVCVPSLVGGAPQVDSLQAPEGFDVLIYARNVKNARSLCVASPEVVFVGSRSEGKVYALVDNDRNFIAERVITVLTGLNSPNGIAFKNGDLYVTEINRVTVYNDVLQNLEQMPAGRVIFDELPNEAHHGWKYTAFGPDGRLYIPVGAPCNICLSEDSVFATLGSIRPDGTDYRIEARGVRNTVGFDWHPETEQLWFTDNGRDWLGDDLPPCELNRVETRGSHFGYPHCHGHSIPDPEFGLDEGCKNFIPPAQELGAHVAPLGMKFYDGKQFPTEYRNSVFIAEHGSWNRSSPVGYRITRVPLDAEGNSLGYEPFITGWLKESRAWGRPVDVALLHDGSLLISDDLSGIIYRVRYTG